MDIDLLEVLNDIKNQKKISMSYIQKTFSIGFNRAGKAFAYLRDNGYINSEGVVNQIKVYEELGEEYQPGLKIIFLDVDGVLNCSTTKDKCGPYTGIEDKKVSLLKQIVSETKAIIVLVSSWKEYWYRNKNLKDKQDDLATYLDEKLSKQGLEIYNKTNEYDAFDRGDGILEYLRYLSRHHIKVDKYVILDDELFDYLETKLTSHLIQTSFYGGGLQEKHVRKAIEKLC